MYVTFESRFDCIYIDWVELLGTRRKRELQNEKFLPTVGLDPTTSRLLVLDWRSNQLRHVSDLVVYILS